MPSSSLLLGVGTILSTLSSPALAAVYEQKEKYTGANWLDAFKFETYEKTNGFVNYVDEHTAKSMGLYTVNSDDEVIFGVDSSEHLNPYDGSVVGRKSVRLEGKTDYNHGLFILDVKQMPSVCGMWPAFWSLGREPWPVKGEIDIIEGVNKNTVNKYVLHTDTQCKVDGLGQSNPQLLTDCALDGPNKASGCDVNDVRTNSFGDGFNDNHGGIYAMEWDSDAIKTWFFPRGTTLPRSLLSQSPDTKDFGIPAANFKGDCNIDQRFKDQRFIFTNTMCGDWAGNVYSQSSCPKYYDNNGNMLDSGSMCRKFVAENPAAFANAKWKVSSFRTFSKKTIVSSSSVAASSTRVSSSLSSSVHVSSTLASSSIAHASSTSVSASVIHASSTPLSSSVHVSVASSSVHSASSASSVYVASASSVHIVSASSVHVASASSSVHVDTASSSIYASVSASSVVHVDTYSSSAPYIVSASSVYDAVSTPNVYPASSAYGDYDSYPAASSAKPYPSYPAGNNSALYPGTAYGTGYTASSAKPHYSAYDETYDNAAKSTPCTTSSAKKAYETVAYPAYPHSHNSAVVYGEYSAKPSKSVKNDYPYLPDFTPVSPVYPEVTHSSVWNNGYGYDAYPEGSKTVVTTTYTTEYVDVCETGYTTIKTTHVVTYSASVTPAAHPTPGNDYPVYPPPGFEVTTKVCNKGCGKGPKTVTVTVPCHNCGGYPTEETGKLTTPVPAMPTKPAEGYNTIYSKVYSTKIVTLSKIVVHESEYPVEHASSVAHGADKPSYPTHGGEVPSHPIYTPVVEKPGKPVQPSSGYGYPAKNGTAPYATGVVHPSASKTGYNTPEFTGAATNIKVGGMIAAAACAALLL